MQISQESTCVEVSFHRSSRPEVFYRKGVLRYFVKFTGKHLSRVSFFNKACNFIERETLAQVFPCEFCKISKSTFCYRTPTVAASVFNYIKKRFQQLLTFENNFFREQSRWLLLKLCYQRIVIFLFLFVCLFCAWICNLI